MVRKDSEAYSMSEGIYVFLVLSIIFQVCLLNNKESLFQDMRYFRYLTNDYC